MAFNKQVQYYKVGNDWISVTQIRYKTPLHVEKWVTHCQHPAGWRSLVTASLDPVEKHDVVGKVYLFIQEGNFVVIVIVMLLLMVSQCLATANKAHAFTVRAMLSAVYAMALCLSLQLQ